MCSDSEKNMSAFADQNHAPSLTCVRLEWIVMQEKRRNIKERTGAISYFGFFRKPRRPSSELFPAPRPIPMTVPSTILAPVLSFIEKHMLKLIEDGAVWGYNIPYLLTGLTDQHPRTAIAATKNHDTKYLDFYHMLLDD